MEGSPMAIITLSYNGETVTIDLTKSSNTFTITIDKKNNSKKNIFRILNWNPFSHIFIFLIDDKRYKAHITTSNAITDITFFPGKTLSITQKNNTYASKQAKTTHKQQALLRSPLAGKVIKKYVSAHQLVKKDQPLVVIESMKMENEIRAETDSFIKTIQINEGDVVQANQVLMTFEDENHSSNKGAQ